MSPCSSSSRFGTISASTKRRTTSRIIWCCSLHSIMGVSLLGPGKSLRSVVPMGWRPPVVAQRPSVGRRSARRSTISVISAGAPKSPHGRAPRSRSPGSRRAQGDRQAHEVSRRARSVRRGCDPRAGGRSPCAGSALERGRIVGEQHGGRAWGSRPSSAAVEVLATFATDHDRHDDRRRPMRSKTAPSPSRISTRLIAQYPSSRARRPCDSHEDGAPE